MFFTVSKIFWLFAAPLNAIWLLVVGALVIRRWKKTWSNKILITAASLFAIFGFLPIGYNMTVFLERQYDRPQIMPDEVDGIIVLGGSFNSYLSEKTGYVAANSNISRIVDFMALSRKYPEAKKVFSGGSGHILQPTRKEADDAQDFLTMAGFGDADIIYERQSRNTYENALYSKELLKPKAGEKWIVITSAFHIPRTMAIFKQLDWDIIPYPSDPKTDKQYQFIPKPFSAVGNFFLLGKSIREFIGVGVYYMTGKSALFFPYPPLPSALDIENKEIS